MDSMTERVPNLDLRFFATAVILQRQTGGDLAEILDKIGYLDSRAIQDLGPDPGTHRRRTAVGHRAVGNAARPVPVMLRLNHDYVMLLFGDPIG